MGKTHQIKKLQHCWNNFENITVFTQTRCQKTAEMQSPKYISTQHRRRTINTRLEKCSGHGGANNFKAYNANPRVNEFAHSSLRPYGVQHECWKLASLGPKNEISLRNKLTLFDVRKDQTTQRMYASCTKLRPKKNSKMWQSGDWCLCKL